jgi:hypothetical protein
MLGDVGHDLEAPGTRGSSYDDRLPRSVSVANVTVVTDRRAGETAAAHAPYGEQEEITMSILSLVIAGAVALFGYVQSRHFVRTRLRYVEAVQKWSAPIVAGAVAALAAAPVVWLLPLVGAWTAVLFGASVAVGVSSGAKDIRRGNAGLLEP